MGGGGDGWRGRNNFGNGNNNNDLFGGNGNNFNDNFGRNGGNSNGGGLSNFVNGSFDDFNRDTFGGMGSFNGNNSNMGSFNGNSNNNGNGANNDGDYHPGNTFLVHLRGMPYDCGEKEISAFFDPLNVVHCEVIYNNNGRHSGEADAYFASYEDAQDAMKKHKEKMGSRYIELFLKNRDDDRRGGNGGGRRF